MEYFEKIALYNAKKSLHKLLVLSAKVWDRKPLKKNAKNKHHI